MSFLDDLMGRPDEPAGTRATHGDHGYAIGGVSPAPGEAPGTPSEIPTVASGNEPIGESASLADRIKAAVPQLDQQTLSAFGEQLLHTYTMNESYVGDAHNAVYEAQTEQADVAVGFPGAIIAMLEFSKLHPGVLRVAVDAFERKHPGALQGR